MNHHYITVTLRGLVIGMMAAAVLIGCAPVFFSSGLVLADGSDDFDNGIRQVWKWGRTAAGYSAELQETGGHLQFTASGSSTSLDQASWEWRATHFPCNSDWDIRLDVHNSVTLTAPDQATGVGIEIHSPSGNDSWLLAELLTEHKQGSAHRKFIANTNFKASTVTADLVVVDGAVRMAFDSTNKIITVYYDADTANGYQWVEFGSFGIAGSGGSSGTVDWGLSENSRLTVTVYGFSLYTAVAAGEMHADNFKETGGRGLCPIAKTLGEHDPATVRLRAFRDRILANSAIGRKIISIYYNNADSINAALGSSPTLRAVTSRVLEALAQRVGKN